MDFHFLTRSILDQTKPSPTRTEWSDSRPFYTVMLLSLSKSTDCISGQWVHLIYQSCQIGNLGIFIRTYSSKCRVSSSQRLSGSSTNQARFKNKVSNGSTCQMKCSTYPKPPFRHKKMECRCSSSFGRSNAFASLLQLASSPLDILFSKCHWYDGTKKNSKTPVMPINGKFYSSKFDYNHDVVFGIPKCPSGCPTSILRTKNHNCGSMAPFSKVCHLNCPNRSNRVKAKCIVDKKTKMPKFTNNC